MSGQLSRLIPVLLIATSLFVAQSGWAEETCTHCQDGTCQDCVGENPHRFWSKKWWQFEAFRPVGARQIDKHGKLWPPYPRPVGKSQTWHHKFHAAHYWPHPYIRQDRAYVRNIIELQQSAGWISATTLFHYHFDNETQLLTEAGKLQLRWILEHTPEPYRVAFVQTADTQNVTQARMANVHTVASELVGDANVPPVMPRVTSTLDRSAAEIQAIRDRWLQAQPVPRIMYEGGAGGGGDSSGNGSASGIGL